MIFSSFIFYASWNKVYLIHFLIVILVNYFIYLKFINSGYKNYILIVSIISNLCNLFFYKYLYFFFEIYFYISKTKFDVNDILGFQPLLPLAISFYTFQIISFMVDASREKYNRISLIDFIFFFSFFPQLIAGPILRGRDFLWQVYELRTMNLNHSFQGVVLILFGTIKKVLIADNISIIIQPIWNSPANYSSLEIFTAIHGFSMQVYCDFSGYSDIAIGSAFLLGYKLPKNFHAPFFSKSFSELWKNWHISLSGWLKDYVYIPMGGNKSKIYLIITFTIGGLWHGAAITFVLWGLFSGILILIENYTFRMNSENQIVVYLRIIITYFLFSFGVIFFRTDSLMKVPDLIKGFFFLKDMDNSYSITPLYFLIPIAFIIQKFDLLDEKDFHFTKLKFLFLLLFILIFFILIGNFGGKSREFIYFQF